MESPRAHHILSEELEPWRDLPGARVVPPESTFWVCQVEAWICLSSMVAASWAARSFWKLSAAPGG